ncbi:serine protease [Lysinibacillus sp. BW-2-10]|uniref:S1 family peptidase n=1 Tax=Lysinibacillus sp. BW-2-10 TaxID=2590030 RepID=UPI00117DB402|nr:serine protease [Lysinibacillus sp. BW-2-10]TSI08593.1 trypsin-like peptidase domain-containing protein [Lysinibacillus sp. BW-2-10]
MDFSKQFEQIKGSVVNICVLNSPKEKKVISSGSGVIIGDGTKIITCSHCIKPNLLNIARFSGEDNARECKITFNDPIKDIAILEVDKSLGKGVRMGDSSAVKIGQEAFVVGFPLNIKKITALSANIAGFEPLDGFELIRIDSSINHGNSGGPLFNSEGELVGIVNAKHGGLSYILTEVQQAKSKEMEVIGGTNLVKFIQILIKQMQRNLNLGIGYAIPINTVVNSLKSSNSLIKRKL